MYRSIIKRSLSDGNILSDTNSPIDDANAENVDNSNKPLSGKTQSCDMGLSESNPGLSTCGSEISFSRQVQLNDVFFLAIFWSMNG